MIVPSTHLFTAGETLDDGDLNRAIHDVYNALQEPPQFVLRQTSLQSIANATWSNMYYWTASKNNDNFMSYGDGGTITIHTPGFYQFIYGVGYTALSTAADTTGIRMVALGNIHGGGLEGRYENRPSMNTGWPAASVGQPYFCYMAEGDTCTVKVYQTSGVTLNTYVASTQGQARWSGRWISP